MSVGGLPNAMPQGEGVYILVDNRLYRCQTNIENR